MAKHDDLMQAPSAPSVAIPLSHDSQLEGRNDRLPYQQAFDRIRAEYMEMPGMCLTAAQVQRLSGIDRAVCESVLDDLERSGFLWRDTNRNYRRLTGTPSARLNRTNLIGDQDGRKRARTA